MLGKDLPGFHGEAGCPEIAFGVKGTPYAPPYLIPQIVANYCLTTSLGQPGQVGIN